MVVGRKHAGKNTVATMLALFLRGTCTKQIDFSDPLTKMLGLLGKADERQNYSELATALKAASFGEEVFRDAVKEKIRKHAGKKDFLIICGARFPEDLDVLHGHDAVIVGIEASVQTR